MIQDVDLEAVSTLEALIGDNMPLEAKTVKQKLISTKHAFDQRQRRGVLSSSLAKQLDDRINSLFVELMMILHRKRDELHPAS